MAEQGCIKTLRLKQILQFLVLLLVADGVFLVYKYTRYHSSPLSPNIIRRVLTNNADSKFDQLIKSDFLLTELQTRIILNPTKLDDVRRNTPKDLNATTTVLFLKTHKTGSSTIQNIIFRYAILHNLTIALPTYKASFFWPYKFNGDKFVRKQAGITAFDMFAHHSIFNKQEMAKVMMPNPEFFTILRDPVSLFRSAYTYYNMDVYCFNHVPVDEIKTSPDFDQLKRTSICPKTQIPARNLQAFDMGLAPRDMENTIAIEALIKHINETMSLVLITERFDESLILLKKKFNWKMEDIVYFKQNAQNSQNKKTHSKSQQVRRRPTKGDEDIRAFNYADDLIYSYFNKQLDLQLKQEFTSEQMEAELRALTSLQTDYMGRCVQEVASTTSTYFTNRSSPHSLFRPYGHQTMGYILKPQSLPDIQCRLLAMPELTLTHYLKGVAASHDP